MKLRLNKDETRFGNALGIDRDRFDLISKTVYNRTKEGKINEDPKTMVLQLMLNDLDGVTPEELLFLGMSFGALEYMNKKSDLEEHVIKNGDPKELANASLNKKAFVENMQNGEHDF